MNQEEQRDQAWKSPERVALQKLLTLLSVPRTETAAVKSEQRWLIFLLRENSGILLLNP